MEEVLVNRLLPTPAASPALDEALRAALPAVYVGFRSSWQGIFVMLNGDVTAGHRSTATQTVLEHDMESRTEEQDELAALADQTSGVIAQYLASPLSDRTPQALYNELQSEINGWASLADAKADLRQWLPMIAAICQLVIRRMKAGDL